ncbi:RidA family protein [Thioalkalivibrio sp. XN8]|uniref:RidA family protein n=1 Tax=Thioalkalivibrio sp. XN8 TaxID=2712863 RepID=UPI0013E9F491|nr:RidA family protein [Thioalkalivibrio sp. XN8]NGP54008.1 RidA family protein [Thioalkalivibrio sp. XN8]
MNARTISFLAGLLLACTAVAGEVEFHPAPGDTDGRWPFSEAVRAGDLLFLSGMLGNRPGTSELAPGGIQPETRQTLENIRAAVLRHGGSMDRVVKCTVFLADMGEWAAMNEVYREFFPVNRPARSALGVNGLALDARVEIECIVALGK